MRARLAVAIAIATTAIRAPSARADPLPLGAIAVGDIDAGTGDSRDLRVPLVGAGLELRPTTMLSLAALAIGVAPWGQTSDDRRPHGAPGGELLLAVDPFPRWPVRPYLRLSAGILLFPGARFLPDGDVYDFILHAGVGASIPLGARVTLAIHADYGHVSNGQGIVPQNPSFTGAGGGIDASYALAERGERDPDVAPVAHDRLGVLVDGEVASPGAWLYAGRVRAIAPVAEHVALQLDVESGALGGDAFVEAGGDAIASWPLVTVGVHGGVRDYAGIYTGIAELQGELHVARAVSLVAAALWQPSSYIGSSGGGIGVRIAPLASLVVDAGEGATWQSGSSSYTPYFDVEWRLPLPAETWGLSLFIERQLDGVAEGGVRIALDRADVRGPVWRRLR